MVALRCSENSTPSALASSDLLGEELAKRRDVHALASTTSPASTGTRSRKTVRRAVAADELDAQRVVAAHDDGLLRAGSRRRSCGPRWSWSRLTRRPWSAGAAGVLLDRCRGAPVGVALAEDRVDRAALDLGRSGPGCPSPRRSGDRRGSPAGRSPALELGDRGLHLGIEALMLGSLMMLASGFRVRAPSSASASPSVGLGRGVSGKLAMMRPDRRDVPRLDSTPGGPGVGRHDGQEGVGRQERRFVGVGVDDLRVSHSGSSRLHRFLASR